MLSHRRGTKNIEKERNVRRPRWMTGPLSKQTLIERPPKLNYKCCFGRTLPFGIGFFMCS
jgi:hypothetical protein